MKDLRFLIHQSKGRQIMNRRTMLAMTVAASVIALPGAAQAHVSFHPNTAPTGSGPTFDVRVPNEMSNARVVKVTIKVPAGITFLQTQPVPGWSSKIKTEKLAKPIKTDDGTITVQPVQVTWTATKGGGTPPDEFQGFPVAMSVPGEAGDVLTFKTVQTYSNGKTVRWIEGPDGENPAPTVNVTAEGGFIQEQAGDAGPPAPGSADASKDTSTTPATPAATASAGDSGDKASKGLGIAALIVGALGLLAGGAALMKRRSASD
jgi:uncharacterized protein YcnI